MEKITKLEKKTNYSYRYGAKRSTSQAVQKLLSLPPIGAEQNVLRHLTFAA